MVLNVFETFISTIKSQVTEHYLSLYRAILLTKNNHGNSGRIFRPYHRARKVYAILTLAHLNSFTRLWKKEITSIYAFQQLIRAWRNNKHLNKIQSCQKIVFNSPQWKLVAGCQSATLFNFYDLPDFFRIYMIYICMAICRQLAKLCNIRHPVCNLMLICFQN